MRRLRKPYRGVLSEKPLFLRGETLNVLEPGRVPYEIVVKELFNHDGEPAESAPHPMETLYIPLEKPMAPGALLRRNGKRRTNFYFYPIPWAFL